MTVELAYHLVLWAVTLALGSTFLCVAAVVGWRRAATDRDRNAAARQASRDRNVLLRGELADARLSDARLRAVLADLNVADPRALRRLDGTPSVAELEAMFRRVAAPGAFPVREQAAAWDPNALPRRRPPEVQP